MADKLGMADRHLDPLGCVSMETVQVVLDLYQTFRPQSGGK